MKNNNFAIVEIGSTNTKGYLYKDGNLLELPFKTINFKRNYAQYGVIIEKDKTELLNYLTALKNQVDNVYVFGTSIFRQLSHHELTEFTNWINKEAQVPFKVVSPEQENKYTVNGTIKNYNHNDTIAVMVGGGGSTEISICKNKRIIEQTNSPFGVVDVLEKFPFLTDNITTISLEEVLEYVKGNLNMPKHKADILILAGGNFILRYEKAEYPTKKNNLFSDINCPIEISIEDNLYHDKIYFNQISLEELRKKTPDTPKWWDGTRAMCACVDAVALELQAKILIPTNTTMVYGIVEELLQINTTQTQ